MMPRLSGIEMVQKLKSRLDTAHIPIILLTARTDEEKVIEGLKSGVADYITKPFRMELLLLKCNNILTTIHAHQSSLRKKFRRLLLNWLRISWINNCWRIQHGLLKIIWIIRISP